MNKRNVIVSAALTIALCVCLIAGSTYAIFTSTDTVNIAAQSATVNITAALDATSLKTGTELSGYTQTASSGVAVFENGGTAKVDATGDNLELTYMTPGDIVDVNVKVDNTSNVKTKYRVTFTMTGELSAALASSVTAGGSTYAAAVSAAGSDYVAKTAWIELDANEDPVFALQIKFPNNDNDGSVDNAFQNKACNVVVTIEAVQGNANV